GNPHLSERSEFGDFHWLLEKSCTFRTAYARNRNWKGPGNKSAGPGSGSWKRRLKCYNNFKNFPFPPWQPPAIYGTIPCHDFRMEDTK
ncbi:hypothetical protein, partial [Hungatella effluvii]|uniref:hypothetical protein n=2 Tax=Hungatella TaxID=1649459 RepID=UPI002A7FA4F3